MSYVFDSNTPVDERTRRRKLAEALMLKATGAEPIASPWQGAAKMAQALMGGVELGMYDKQDREDREYGQKGRSELDGMGSGPTAQPQGPSPVAAVLSKGAPVGGFSNAVSRTLGFEGGLNPADTNGTPTNFGINQAANPDVDVKSLDKNAATALYKTRYWDTIGGDKIAAQNPALAHVAFDTSVIAGPGKARELLAQSGGDPLKFLQLRENFQNALLQRDPEKFGKYQKAWGNRIAGLRADVGYTAPAGSSVATVLAGGGGQPQVVGGDTLEPPAKAPGQPMTLPSAQPSGMMAVGQQGGAPNVQRLMQLAFDPRMPKDVQDRAKFMLQQAQKEQPKYGFTVAPDGTVLRTSERDGTATPIGSYAKPDPTTTQREYEQAKREGFQGTILDYAKAVAEARSNKTSINMPNEKAGALMATKGVEAMDAANASMREAQRRIATYGQLATSMQGFTPGATAEAKMKAKAVLKDLGIIEGADVPDAQAFDALSKRIELAAAPKGQGQITENERAIIRSTIPTLKSDPAAIGLIISNLQKLDEYDIKVARIYRDNARKNGGVPNYLDVQDEIDKLGPPMSERELMALQRLGQGAQAPAMAGGGVPDSPKPAPAPQQAAQPKSKAEYDALPSGAVFIAPDGSQRRKP